MSLSTSPRAASVVGALMVAPFLTANAIVGNKIEPYLSLIRPGGHTGVVEYSVLAVVLLCLPVGALIAARPMFAGAHGRRRLYLLNGVVAALMVALFLALSIGLGSDIYRCDVLKIPNCD